MEVIDMRKLFLSLLVFFINVLVSHGQSFSKFHDGDSFGVQSYTNEFKAGQGELLVTVTRPDDSQFILGTIEMERNLGFFVSQDRIFFLRGPRTSDGLFNLWLCDGRNGSFSRITDVTATYFITDDRKLIIYDDDPSIVSVPNITIKNISGEILKIIQGDNLLIEVKRRYSIDEDHFTVSLFEDKENHRLLFTYNKDFSGEITLTSLDIELFNKDEHLRIIDQYFPYAGL